jgi:fermentation-respiration switch protein FrsA (DUF1100 family)
MDFGMIADFWHNEGCSILFAEQRAQNNSEGKYMTFGYMERYDCLDWIHWVNERTDSQYPIYLAGVSMGASTVLMASALPLPPQVKGIVADCGYTSPEAIIRKVCREDMGIPDRLAYPFVRVAARLFGRFSMKDGGAVEAVKQASVPVLIVHGTGDGFVPHAMCRELYGACASQDKELLEVAEAGHGLAYFYDGEAYERAVRAFHRRTLED